MAYRGVDSGLPWVMKILRKSEGCLVLLLFGLPHHCCQCFRLAAVLQFLLILFKSTLFLLHLPSFVPFWNSEVFWFFFSLFQISGPHYGVFILNWKHPTFGVVQQKFLNVLVFFLFLCFLQWRLVVLDLQKMVSFWGNSSSVQALMYRFCRWCCVNDTPKVLIKEMRNENTG